MKNKKSLVLFLLLIITVSVSGCKIKIDDTFIKCNELTGECVVEDSDTSSGTAGKFVPDEGTLTVVACAPYKAPDKGIFKGFYYSDSEPDSTENRWSMSMCGTSSYFATAQTTCSDGRTYKWEVNKLAKTTFEKAQQGLCKITTTGIDGIIYDPSEITSNGTVVSRFVGGTKVPTLHSYGIAIDFNAGKSYVVNGTKYQGVYDRDLKVYNNFVSALGSEYDSRNVNFILYKKIFQPLGFNWGGNWGDNYDGMHFEIDYKQTEK